MLYSDYTIGGELYHSAKGNEWGKHKYVDKVRTKSGKWRYIYQKEAMNKKNAKSKLKSSASELGNAAYDYWHSGAKARAAKVKQQREEHDERVEAMKDQLRDDIQKTKDSARQLGEDAKSGANRAAQDVKDAANSAKNSAKNKVDDSRDSLADLLDELEKKVRSKR